jgi:hypothetical protein
MSGKVKRPGPEKIFSHFSSRRECGIDFFLCQDKKVKPVIAMFLRTKYMITKIIV